MGGASRVSGIAMHLSIIPVPMLIGSSAVTKLKLFLSVFKYIFTLDANIIAFLKT